jgi:hypothetical protein
LAIGVNRRYLCFFSEGFVVYFLVWPLLKDFSLSHKAVGLGFFFLGLSVFPLSFRTCAEHRRMIVLRVVFQNAARYRRVRG